MNIELDSEEIRLYANLFRLAVFWVSLRVFNRYRGRSQRAERPWTRAGWVGVADQIALLSFCYVVAFLLLVRLSNRIGSWISVTPEGLRYAALVPSVICLAVYSYLRDKRTPGGLAPTGSRKRYIVIALPVFAFWLTILSLIGLYSHKFPWSEPTTATVLGSILATAFTIWAYAKRRQG